MILSRKGRRIRGFDAKPSTAAILEGTILATRSSNGVLMFDSKEEEREWERKINQKAGMIAAMITIAVALGALCFCQRMGWLSL